VAFLWADAADVKSYPIDIQALLLRDYLFFVIYFWVAGIVLAFFASWIVTDFIAGEVSRGTLLSLITKPIHRWEVLLGKFIAYIIFITIVELIAIFISIYVLVTFSGSHLSVIGELIQYLPILLLFSLFVALVFGTIPLALSTISKSRVLVMIIMAALVLVMYISFFIIRTRSPDFYADYHLYNFDLGYHMGNIFISFTEAANVHLTPVFQEQMGLFAGTHDLGVSLDEPDQGFQLASIPLTNYYSQLSSWLIWTLIPLGLTVLTLFKLKKKEVQ
jgi:ABC-type transport system involved in multi-copper enzyme maturation permease subunit